MRKYEFRFYPQPLLLTQTLCESPYQMLFVATFVSLNLTSECINVTCQFLTIDCSPSLSRKQVNKSKFEAEKDGIKVPTTVEEYCVKTKPKPPETDDILNDFYDDDYGDDLDDEEDDDMECLEDSDDSGNEDS